MSGVVRSDLNDCNDHMETRLWNILLMFTDILLSYYCHEFFKRVQALHMKSVTEPLRTLQETQEKPKSDDPIEGLDPLKSMENKPSTLYQVRLVVRALTARIQEIRCLEKRHI